MKRRIALAAALLLLGCQQILTPEQLRQQMESELSFLQDGRTTREEVLSRLGQPTSEFEGQRILTYRIRQDEKGHIAVWPVEAQPAEAGRSTWEGLSASVVLVFEGPRLVRHSVVPMKTALTTTPQ